VCGACRKQVAGPPPRYAVLRFENLSGDPSLEWTARATSEILSRSLAGVMSGPVLHSAALARAAATLGSESSAAPGISSDPGEARLAGATRVITGYIQKVGNGIRIEASERDLTTQKTVRSVAAEDSTSLGAITAIAKQLSSNAQRYVTSDANAVRFYATGLESAGADAELEQAVAADPNFGPAWAALATRQLAHGDRDAAKQTIARSSRYHLDDYDQATIDAANASLNNDRHARVEALRRISALSPGDTVLLRTVAQSEIDVGEFADAASDWNKLAAVLPNDANAWNLLGYARAYTGDYQGALNAIREYQRLDPKGANPLDSIGDVHFLFRKFQEAAASYLAANAKNPEFMNHGELYKAAWAKYYAGDKSGAESLFGRFRFARDKAHDSTVRLFVADWLYRTGRSADAIALLRAETQNGSAAKPLVYSQLAIWDLLAGDRPAAARDAASAGTPQSLPLLLARFCALPPASAQQWRERAEKMIQGNGAGNLRLLALGYALVLDDKSAEAIPVWEQIVDKSPGTDFFLRAVLSRLQDQSVKQPIVPSPAEMNEFAAVLDRL
jgi:tetratricopeptide (TPR) repeat protein